LSVFVFDRKKKPLMPCSEKRARLLLTRGKAVVDRMYPFTIRLKERVGGEVQPVRVKLDPGAKVTGVAIVREAEVGQHVLDLAEIAHKGALVRKRMLRRATYRRRRQSAHQRRRAKRFDNRRRPPGGLPPSLRCRIDHCELWVNRYQRLAPVRALSVEHVRFDLQKMANPEISEHQRGRLAGYESRECLLEKWNRQCAYCGAANCPLNIDHREPRARGGSDRVSNLTLACAPCDQKKGKQPIEVFLAHQPQVLERVLACAKSPLRDAAAANTTRWGLVNQLRKTGLKLELSSGGRTKWNRAQGSIPKTHALDAACVGEVGCFDGWRKPVLQIGCAGRGAYQRSRVDSFGFPRGVLMRAKQVRGFQTGDMVRAVVARGVHAGSWIGRLAIRLTGRFNLQTGTGVLQGIGWKCFRLFEGSDGCHYSTTKGGAFSPCLKAGFSAPIL
jgi:5-methylcytosine-specific restriction endonuclease McrA